MANLLVMLWQVTLGGTLGDGGFPMDWHPECSIVIRGKFCTGGDEVRLKLIASHDPRRAELVAGVRQLFADLNSRQIDFKTSVVRADM